ncbi:transposable element Tcb1 transposase [Trichonephila clavipes]|nr:transposable element Tcb1 transposase [Trichonephila clavipes]
MRRKKSWRYLAGRRAVLLAVDRSECAVRNCWGAVDTRRYPRGKRSGATRKATRKEDQRIVRQALVDPTVTRSTIQADVGVAIVPNNFPTPCKANLNPSTPCTPLPSEHWQLRLHWCQTRSMWNVTDWQKVVFSDERFVWGPDDNRVRVWRRPIERYNSSHTVLRHTTRTAGVKRLEPIDENSACVEVEPLTYNLRRGVNLLKHFNYITCEEVKSQWNQRFHQILDTSRASNKEPEKKVGYFHYLKCIKTLLKRISRDIHQFAARLTANFQYYSSLRKVNSFESLCDLIISDKLFETLNKETATHIGIREAEDWLRPIDLAKECEIYISSRSGSHKEIRITYGYTQDPLKNRSQNFKPKIKENYPQNLERENKNCFICGDSSHYTRDCEKRFKPKESNSHIHNRINVNTLKVESEKQNDEFAHLQYVNIFVENQPVTALIDSGCQIPVLNSSLIRVQTPSEEIITLSSCFGEQRMVEVKPINISLDQQHSSGLSVRTAISPTLTEEIYYTSQCIF